MIADLLAGVANFLAVIWGHFAVPLSLKGSTILGYLADYLIFRLELDGWRKTFLGIKI
jgi:hypothetical protein